MKGRIKITPFQRELNSLYNRHKYWGDEDFFALYNMILDKEVNINQIHEKILEANWKHLCCPDFLHNNDTALILAAKTGKVDVVKTLMSRIGVEGVNSSINNSNAISTQDLFNQEKSIEAINMKDKEGNTALHWAAKQGCSDIVWLLISNGAKPELLNNKKFSPIELAIGNEHKITEQVLNCAKEISVSSIIFPKFLSLSGIKLNISENEYDLIPRDICEIMGRNLLDLEFYTPISSNTNSSELAVMGEQESLHFAEGI